MIIIGRFSYRPVDMQLNIAMRTVPGCLCSATSSPCRFAVIVPPCRSTWRLSSSRIVFPSRRSYVSHPSCISDLADLLWPRLHDCKSKPNWAGDMGAVVDWRGATRTWCRDNKPNVSTTWVHSTETSVRHSKSSEMWRGQMCRISLPMGCDRITCLPLRRERPYHKAHCWRVSTHCIPWRPATSTRSGSRCSGMVIKTVYETVRVF